MVCLAECNKGPRWAKQHGSSENAHLEGVPPLWRRRGRQPFNTAVLRGFSPTAGWLGLVIIVIQTGLVANAAQLGVGHTSCRSGCRAGTLRKAPRRGRREQVGLGLDGLDAVRHRHRVAELQFKK